MTLFSAQATPRSEPPPLWPTPQQMADPGYEQISSSMLAGAEGGETVDQMQQQKQQSIDRENQKHTILNSVMSQEANQRRKGSRCRRGPAFGFGCPSSPRLTRFRCRRLLLRVLLTPRPLTR